ncbi:CidA/LrgA family protein [Bacillus spongiae]|uniref:CidA/LrgA family protein n=1 Tax=Bacillus spongiae TaxID=2683610 RepID=A0ABU8HG10_9BACI
MKNWWRISIQLFVFVAFYEVGLFITYTFSVPIPGNVLGMMLLFLLLLSGVIKVEWIENGASLLLKHLAFFFVPVAVGMMTLGGIFKENGVFIIITLVTSTAIGIVLTGVISQLVVKEKEVKSHE